MGHSDLILDDFPKAVQIGEAEWISYYKTKKHPKAGLFDIHKNTESPSGWCIGSLTFDLPDNNPDNRPVWKVESWEPLTLSPSLLCKTCGHHGFIRNGKWENA